MQTVSSDVWPDYKDSTDGVYMGMGAVCCVLAVALIVAAIGLIRGWCWRG